MYLAGDDDQAIYAWAGADVTRFVKEPAREIVLRRSRRISKAVQEESTRPINNILGIRKLKNIIQEIMKANHITYLILTRLI